MLFIVFMLSEVLFAEGTAVLQLKPVLEAVSMEVVLAIQASDGTANLVGF